MTATLNQFDVHQQSQQRLQHAYDLRFIAPEKKPFLIDLRRSFGPYLAVHEGDFICDGASQIASVGLGFNAGPLFGAAEHLESWINLTCSPNAYAIRMAFEQLLQRKLGSDQFVARFCASGAEAVETVLAHFFERRTNKSARQVLAFEGSFHGRMMVALASTWNRAKREPFAWPSYSSIFAPFPVMDSDDMLGQTIPNTWQTLWCERNDASFKQHLAAAESTDDALLRREIEALCQVRSALASGNVFAILIEPMQCEGGDRYASARFHQGLVYLAESYGVPLAYDEIQTGFGLGGEFFWHRMLELVDRQGQPFLPAGVICAKKAQVGVALVREAGGARSAAASEEQFCSASLIRGYIQGSVMDQFQPTIVALEHANRQRLQRLAQRFAPQLLRPRAKGLCFAFDFETVELTQQFISHRFQHGLLYYPAGSQTARFRFNLGFRPHEIELFWQQLKAALEATLGDRPDPVPGVAPPREIASRGPEGYYTFHEHFIATKLAQLRGATTSDEQVALDLLHRQLATAHPSHDFEVLTVDATNYADYRSRILDMQQRVYEPARQSPPAEFDALFQSDNPISILVLAADEIVAMSFAGPLHLFQQQRGVPDDPYRDDPSVVYMLDLTVAEPYRGGLGAALKQATTVLAESRGVTAIHGRNRDRLAAGMWAINLSLGSYVTNYLVDDYPDHEPYRDCLYYRCPLRWERPPLDLGAGIDMPLGIEQLDADFIREQLPAMVNKLTLSNFVTPTFLNQLEQVATVFPAELRHVYASSGLSECVDKIAKIFWRARRPRSRLLTIEGSDFGCGSFLARSLSDVGEAMFEVERLPWVTAANADEFFALLDDQLQRDDLLGMFVEPLSRRTMRRLAPEHLQRIVERCRTYETPIVYNDTASLFYRYSERAFAASGVPGLLPDATIAYLGGQMGMVGCADALFLDQPLLLISTWEGDAFSLGQFHRALQAVVRDEAAYHQTVADYHHQLKSQLAAEKSAQAELVRGVGWVQGQLTGQLAQLLRRVGEQHWISCPSYTGMQRFLADYAA